MNSERAFTNGPGLDPFEQPLAPPHQHPLVWDLAAVLKGRPSDVRIGEADSTLSVSEWWRYESAETGGKERMQQRL